MLLMTPEPDTSLLENFLALDALTPEGYRAELIDGAITVTPPPGGNHEHWISRVISQVIRMSTTAMDVSGQKGLIVPSDGEPDLGRVIPDLTFAPARLNLFREAPPWMEPDGVEMIVEVTSSHPDNDRKPKRHAYAAAAIPLYLLIDREERRVTLFSDPATDDYRRTTTVPFGGSIDLPEPFSFTLGTADFADSPS